MDQIIEQKQFNSPTFCSEITTCVKEYASRNGLEPKNIFVAKRNDDYTFRWIIRKKKDAISLQQYTVHMMPPKYWCSDISETAYYPPTVSASCS